MIGNKQYWGDGYGTDAKMLQLRYAFYQENIRKMISSVYATNERSIAYLKKCGYKKEGIRKDSRYVNGRYVDVILMAVFQRDWEPIWDEYANKYDLK
jgi:RimJ/RimL family protein N-acetyltransferase